MVDDMPERPSSAKLKIAALLSGMGGLAGAVAGAVLTYLGNVISGYPIPPSLEIYLSNAGIIAVVGALLGPPLAWTMMRAVPLWRAVLETAAGGLGAGVLSMLVAPSFFVAAVPAGIAAAALRLSFVYRDPKPEQIPPSEGRAYLPRSGAD